MTTGRHIELCGCVKEKTHLALSQIQVHTHTHTQAVGAAGVCADLTESVERAQTCQTRSRSTVGAPSMSRPPVRGAAREGWQTLVSTPRGTPGEVRITHTRRLPVCAGVENKTQSKCVTAPFPN